MNEYLQEIKLERINSDDKLGLTLCDDASAETSPEGAVKRQTPAVAVASTASTAATTTTAAAAPATQATPETRSAPDDNEVYIQAIAENSLAAVDGRLCRGDTLLQVSVTFLIISYWYGVLSAAAYFKGPTPLTNLNIRVTSTCK